MRTNEDQRTITLKASEISALSLDETILATYVTRLCITVSGRTKGAPWAWNHWEVAMDLTGPGYFAPGPRSAWWLVATICAPDQVGGQFIMAKSAAYTIQGRIRLHGFVAHPGLQCMTLRFVGEGALTIGSELSAGADQT